MIDLQYEEIKNLIDTNSISYKEIEFSNKYIIFGVDGIFKCKCTVYKDSEDATDYIANYKPSSINFSSVKSDVVVSEQTPFAKPDYRTKMDATTNWETCSASTETIIDFAITEERYVSGGEIIYKNAKEGDYITAEVCDKDGFIPEPYRAMLAENWPTVARYVVKKWLIPTEIDKYNSFEVNTYPLNARIPPNFYLRVTYHASSESGDRKCAVNYQLTKKL